MSNNEYKATARTNYFAVKDITAFEAEIAEICKLSLGFEGYHLQTKKVDGIDTYAILFYTDDGGRVPMQYWTSDNEHRLVNWSDLFRRHLQDDWVAILMEVGSINHDWLQGFAEAYNNKLETTSIFLSHIYTQAKNLGKHITTTEDN